MLSESFGVGQLLGNKMRVRLFADRRSKRSHHRRRRRRRRRRRLCRRRRHHLDHTLRW